MSTDPPTEMTNPIRAAAAAAEAPAPTEEGWEDGPAAIAITVLGMHRSGTSALARTISLLGADLPHNLMPCGDENPTGYWEPQPIVELNNAVLAAAASSWDDVSRFPEDWYGTAAEAEFRRRAAALLTSEYWPSRRFVLKDPRICRIVPFWLKTTATLGISPAFAITVRNPLEVAASLKERNGLSFAKGLLLWLRHMIDAERDTRGRPRAFVSYPRLIADWESEVRSISENLGVTWPRLDHRTRAEVEQFVSAQHRHHEASHADLAAHPAAVDWVVRVYTALDGACITGEAPHVSGLDEVGSVLDAADRAYAPLLAEVGIAREDYQRRLAQRRAQLAQRDEELMRSEQELAGREKERDQLQSRLATLESEAGQLSSQLEASEERLQESQAAAAHGDEERARLQAEFQTLVSEAEALREERRGGDLELDHRSKELARATGELAELRAQATHSTAESESLRSRVAGQREQLKQRDDELVRSEQELAGREQERDQLQSRFATLESEAGQLRSQLEASEERLQESQAAAAHGDEERGRLHAELQTLVSEAEALREERRQEIRERDRLVAELSNRDGESEEMQAELVNLEAELKSLHDAFHRMRRETALTYLNARPARKWRSTAKLISWVFPIPRRRGRTYLRTFLALRRSKSFDYGFYLAANPDVATDRENALMHYIEHGATDGRNPSPHFSTSEYLDVHPELAESGINPLLHHLRNAASPKELGESR